MPTCTPESVQASGATFQAADIGNLRLARVGLLYLQNGSTGTPNSLLATGASLQAVQPGRLQMLLVGVLWKASGGVKTVPQLLAQSEPYQQTSSGGLDLCATVSEWITEGSPGTISTVLATAKLFQQLTALELIIVEIVLLCDIYGISISASGLTTTAVNAGFETCDTGQLSLIEANLYCQLS